MTVAMGKNTHIKIENRVHEHLETQRYLRRITLNEFTN